MTRRWNFALSSLPIIELRPKKFLISKFYSKNFCVGKCDQLSCPLLLNVNHFKIPLSAITIMLKTCSRIRMHHNKIQIVRKWQNNNVNVTDNCKVIWIQITIFKSHAYTFIIVSECCQRQTFKNSFRTRNFKCPTFHTARI